MEQYLAALSPPLFSNHNLLDLIERNLIAAAIIEPSRLRAGVVGDLLGVFDRPAVLTEGGDASRSERMIGIPVTRVPGTPGLLGSGNAISNSAGATAWPRGVKLGCWFSIDLILGRPLPGVVREGTVSPYARNRGMAQRQFRPDHSLPAATVQPQFESD